MPWSPPELCFQSSGTFQNSGEYRLSILRSWALGIWVLKVSQVTPILGQASQTVTESCHMPGSVSCWVELLNDLILTVSEPASSEGNARAHSQS